MGTDPTAVAETPGTRRVQEAAGEGQPREGEALRVMGQGRSKAGSWQTERLRVIAEVPEQHSKGSGRQQREAGGLKSGFWEPYRCEVGDSGLREM